MSRSSVRIVIALWVTIWLALAIQDGDLFFVTFNALSAMAAAAWRLLVGRDRLPRRGAEAAGLLLAGGGLIVVGAQVSPIAHFWTRHAAYVNEAAEALDKANKASLPPIVAIPDARDAFFVFIYDPTEIGPMGRRPFIEAPLNCSQVAAHWVHCPIS